MQIPLLKIFLTYFSNVLSCYWVAFSCQITLVFLPYYLWVVKCWNLSSSAASLVVSLSGFSFMLFFYFRFRGDEAGLLINYDGWKRWWLVFCYSIWSAWYLIHSKNKNCCEVVGDSSQSNKMQEWCWDSLICNLVDYHRLPVYLICRCVLLALLD